MSRPALFHTAKELLPTAVLLAAFFSTLAMPCESLAADVLPIPAPPFAGKIAKSIKDSVPDWPKSVKAPENAPNIVLILLDDVGFGAAGTFGGPAETPALDRLARSGLRYNRFHTTALCSPTRAALLTGRNHHRVGFGSITAFDSGFPGYDAIWRKDTVSVAEVLQRNGYSTAAFGKWHNTPRAEERPMGPFDHWPTSLGFEYFYGFMDITSQWEPALYRNTVPVAAPAKPRDGYNFLTDMTDDAVGWIRSHESFTPEKPYFIYFAPFATHAPHHVPKEWIEKYEGRFQAGWDKLREEILARQKTLGVAPKSTVLTRRPDELPAWSSLDARQKQLYARQMEVYAGFLSYADHEVGRLLEVAQAGARGENTLVLYIVGDNGASAEGGLNGTDWQIASLIYGVASPVDEQLRHLDDLGGPRYENHFATAWGWAMSTPFPWMKQIASHLGGTRNPMVVSWPARIKNQGGLRSQFAHVIDVAPTIYEASGIAFPAVVDSVRQEPLDGVSLVATFERAGAPEAHRIQYFEMMGNRAIYQDGWMASARHSIPWITTDRSEDFEHDRWELYDLNSDFSQAHDVAQRFPAKLLQMRSLFDREAQRNDVYPLNNGYSTAKPFAQSIVKAEGGQEFVFYRRLPRMAAYTAPNMQRSHRLTAHLIVTRDRPEGVIMADGGRYGGFVFYVRDGFPIYEVNSLGKETSVVKGSERLPKGKVELAYEFIADQGGRFAGGTGRISVNGANVGEEKITQAGPPSALDTFDIGEDRASPVSEAYEPPFPFSDEIERVELRLL